MNNCGFHGTSWDLVGEVGEYNIPYLFVPKKLLLKHDMEFNHEHMETGVFLGCEIPSNLTEMVIYWDFTNTNDDFMGF